MNVTFVTSHHRHHDNVATALKLPARKAVAGKLLNEEVEIQREHVRNLLDGTYQTLSIDGWIGASNTPILGACVGHACIDL